MSIRRVFIDTNVLLSGLAFGGNEATVLRLAAANQVRLVISQAVLRETRSGIDRKFPQLAGDLEDLLSKVSWESVDYPDAEAIASASRLIRDPNDAPILASIILAKPDFALTGDKDLLTDEVKAIAPVCTCADYLRSLTAES